MIVFLRCSDNRALTVFSYFRQAISTYGVPSRVRTDKDKENTEIAWFMLNTRGPDRGSHIAGRSVHNQRIERLWRDVFIGCTSSFYNLFFSMEHDNIVDVNDELRLLCLHTVFMARINRALSMFQTGFNNAPLRTERHRSPTQLWFHGLMTNSGEDDICMVSRIQYNTG